MCCSNNADWIAEEKKGKGKARRVAAAPAPAPSFKSLLFKLPLRNVSDTILKIFSIYDWEKARAATFIRKPAMFVLITFNLSVFAFSGNGRVVIHNTRNASWSSKQVSLGLFIPSRCVCMYETLVLGYCVNQTGIKMKLDRQNFLLLFFCFHCLVSVWLILM